MQGKGGFENIKFVFVTGCEESKITILVNFEFLVIFSLSIDISYFYQFWRCFFLCFYCKIINLVYSKLLALRSKNTIYQPTDVTL